jgi:hypothetical protein
MYNEITVEIWSLLGFNPIFKGDAPCSAITDGADMFFPKRRYGNTSVGCVKSKNNADLVYIAAKAWNHA